MTGTVVDTSFVRRDLRAAILPWIVARVIVGATLAATRFMVVQIDGREEYPLRQGLFGWDATFYRLIAEHGYEAVGEDGLRFFPLVSILGRIVGLLFLGNSALGLLVVVNVSALVFGALLHRLVLLELHDARAARRAVWFASLLPPAVVLVMGYAEATFLVLAVGVFLAVRTGRFAWAIPLGVAAGLCRPLGILLVVPVAIEAGRHWRGGDPRTRWTSLAAVAAPVAGLAVFLAWARRAYGNFLLPLQVQSGDEYRGDLVDPLSRTVRAAVNMFRGDIFDSGRALVWLVALVVLLIVIARRLPVSYTAYAAVVLGVAMSSEVIQSLERYTMTAFPFVIGLAIVSARVEVERCVLAVLSAGMVGYGVLIFSGVLVP